MAINYYYGSGAGVPESNAATQTQIGGINQGYDQLYQNQLGLYNQTLKGYQDAIGQYAGIGAASQQQIQANMQRQTADANQLAISKGLGGSTNTANSLYQVGANTNVAQAANADQLAGNLFAAKQSQLGYQGNAAQWLGAVQKGKLDFNAAISNQPSVDPSTQAQIAATAALQTQKLQQQRELQTQQIGAGFAQQASGASSAASLQNQRLSQQNQQEQARLAAQNQQAQSNLNPYKGVMDQITAADAANQQGSSYTDNGSLTIQNGYGNVNPLTAGGGDAGYGLAPGQVNQFTPPSVYGLGLQSVAGANQGGGNINIVNGRGASSPGFENVSPIFGPGAGVSLASMGGYEAGSALDVAGAYGGADASAYGAAEEPSTGGYSYNDYSAGGAGED